MAGGKWIDELTPGTAPEDAARRVLALRLEVVRQYVALALREPEKDVEHVHQLRVGTRRARAALDIFASCLPPRVLRKAKRDMRDLRRAAGEARDWDVFLADLSQRVAERPPRRRRGGLDFLMGYAMGHRLEAQDTLTQAVPDEFAIDRLSAELLHAVRRPEAGPDTLADLARTALRERLQDLERAVTTDLSSYDNLHQVRIAGKRLRYAMEVFACCFEPDFRTVHYSAVEEMQEILGHTNDSHVACQRLELLREKTRAMLPGQWKRFQADFDALLHFHEERLAEGLPQFEQWWRQWQESGGELALMKLLQPAPPQVSLAPASSTPVSSSSVA